jgi:hypothetical protein
MMMRRCALSLLLILASTATSIAGELVNAAEITERNRPLDRILDLCVPPRGRPRGRPPEEGRTLAIVVDPTASLQKASFDAAFRSAVHRHRGGLATTSIFVLDPGGIRLGPTKNLEKVTTLVEDLVAKPDASIRNVYKPVRAAAEALAERPGQREILLVTLENGDAEDDLEKTVAALVRAGVRVNVIARESFLSDTWWAIRPTLGLPKHRMSGTEGAFPELPWSFVFQRAAANQAVSSGFAMFGLSRLAAETGGKVWLHYPTTGSRTLCIPGTGCICPICHHDHLDCSEEYQHHRLRALAPLIGPRRKVGSKMASDPYFQAAIGAWTVASKKGVMIYRPTVEWTGDGLRVAPLRHGKRVLLGDTAAFTSQANRAEKAVRALDLILGQLRDALKHADTTGGSERGRAIAEFTRVMLEVTRFNYLHYRAFCRDVGPTWETEEAAARLRPPEIPVLRPDYLYYRIAWINLSLCHGVGPYLDHRFPGGERLQRELASLDESVRAFRAKYAKTPFAQAIRRQCLARFYLVGSPQAGYTAPRWVPRAAKKGAETPAAGPRRPTRGAPSGGGSGGTTTGGGD